MRVLSQYLPSGGHFPWCPYRFRLSPACEHHDHGCDHCKLLLYSVAIVLNIFVAALEFWGSGRTQSTSLSADAWHVISDGLGNVIGVLAALSVLYTSVGSRREKRQKYFEFLAGLFVMCVGFLILMNSGNRLINGILPEIVEGKLLLGVAAIGLLVNVLLWFAFRMLRVEHSHVHDTSDHHDDGVLSANIAHTLGDAAASIGVLLNASLFVLFGDRRVGYLDLAISCLIALWLMKQAWDVLEDSARK